MGVAMTTPPQSWRPLEIEAYRAWQSGDSNRLLKACDRMIRSHARGFARRSRRGSDELHPKKEAGLYEAKVVADFDELYQVGCEAVGLNVQRDDGHRLCEKGFASACNSKNTKLHGLIFHAVPGDGPLALRIEWMLTR